jgi:hypothetical protein
MTRFVGASLAALASLCALAAESRAEVVVQTPVGTFVFGRLAPRCAPGVDVQVGRIAGVHVRPVPDAPPGLPVLPPPQPLPNEPLPIGPPPGVLPAPRPVEVAPVIPTLPEFAATFRHARGRTRHSSFTRRRVSR